MKQPDLGRKILELRLAKGLTQSELAEKCHLGVRTIQRIESAEVTPRSYTVKQIFACLDYEIYNSFGKFSYRLDRSTYMIKNWLEQLYKYVIDLFNLKTNTMKKLMILSIPFISICLILCFSINSTIKAQSKVAAKLSFEKASYCTSTMRQFNSGQIDSIGNRHLESACSIGEATIIGRKNITDNSKNLYNEGYRFSTIKSLAKVITDSIAIDRGVWAINVNSVPIATGTYLTQWHYLKGKWWIENEMSMTDKIINLELFK